MEPSNKKITIHLAGVPVEIEASDAGKLLDAIFRRKEDVSPCRFSTADELIETNHGELSLREAAAALYITEVEATRLIRHGVLRARMVGRIYLVDAASVAELRTLDLGVLGDIIKTTETKDTVEAVEPPSLTSIVRGAPYRDKGNGTIWYVAHYTHSYVNLVDNSGGGCDVVREYFERNFEPVRSSTEIPSASTDAVSFLWERLKETQQELGTLRTVRTEQLVTLTKQLKVPLFPMYTRDDLADKAFLTASQAIDALFEHAQSTAASLIEMKRALSTLHAELTDQDYDDAYRVKCALRALEQLGLT